MSSIYFTEDHEWLRVENGVATVGITAHAQEQLGDLVFIEQPDVGRMIAKGEAVAVVESVKAASDVYAPLDGKVTEINEALASDPATVNQAAESNGWLWKMTLVDEGQLSGLMDETAYKTLIG